MAALKDTISLLNRARWLTQVGEKGQNWSTTCLLATAQRAELAATEALSSERNTTSILVVSGWRGY